jgi:hypothetical protein
MASSVNNPAWLEWIESLMGGVSRKNYSESFPPDRYYCLLDELPLHLIPRPALLAPPQPQRDLFFNPDCSLYPAGMLPQEIGAEQEFLPAFASQGTIAWVRQPDKSLVPFWLGPKLDSLLKEAQPREPIQTFLDPITQSILERAGIIISGEHALDEKRHQERRIANAGTLFRKKGYAPLRDLIHPFHVAALRRYYRYKVRTGAIQLGDGQSPRRYIAYNDPIARFFHGQIAATLSAVAGEPIKPSYVYLASYLSGAELRKHTDREQCEFSITFCLDFSPEPTLATPWPICLDTPTGTVTIYQALGDGLVYRGTRLPHYRSKLGEGQTSTSIFFHYVAADFTGSLD